jgi:hypothetical protein
MIPHCLFQFIPVADEIYNYFLLSRLEPISAVVASAISQHLQGRNQAERVEMLQKLEGGAKASSFYGFLFEPHAREGIDQGEALSNSFSGRFFCPCIGYHS